MLVIQNLYKQFGNIKAIDHVNLSIEIGEIVVLMGPSGCGKSTTIRTINRLIEPDQGTILLNNSNILTMGADELQKIRKNIGFVFQHFNLIGRLSALENVMFGLVMSGMDRVTAYCKAIEALTKVGMEQQHLNHTSSQLSGGQQRAWVLPERWLMNRSCYFGTNRLHP